MPGMPALPAALGRIWTTACGSATHRRPATSRFIPGRREGCRPRVPRHTTTNLSPEEFHQAGLAGLAARETEWAELGGGVLQTCDLSAILDSQPRDRPFRFPSSPEIGRTVTDA